jgi:hypothetical protein
MVVRRGGHNLALNLSAILNGWLIDLRPAQEFAPPGRSGPVYSQISTRTWTSSLSGPPPTKIVPEVGVASE